MYNPYEIREEFPILQREVYGKKLIYLDNAATTQKPLCVINSITEAYTNVNANVHRGVHFLSQKATEQYEDARETVRAFINARHRHEVIFTRGTTESINSKSNTTYRTFYHMFCCHNIPLSILFLYILYHKNKIKSR